MERLSQLAHEQQAAEVTVAQMEEGLKAAKKRLSLIADEALPELMEQLGLEDFTTSDGLKIDVKETIRANISPDNRARVFAWLKSEGKDGIIKHKVVVDFGKGNEEAAEELSEILQSHAWKYKDDKSIHAQTLSAFVREQLGEGIELPSEISVFRQRRSKIG